MEKGDLESPREQQGQTLNERHLQRYSSDVLWHFVGYQHKNDHAKCLATLLSILKEGKLRLGTEPEPFIYHGSDGKKHELCGYQACCIADIPLKDLVLHAKRYGTVAIGFHREAVIKHNFMPICYVPQRSWLVEHYLKIRDELESYLYENAPDKAEKFQEFLSVLGTIVKACDFSGEPHDDQAKDAENLNNFYYEREWRSIHEWPFKPEDVAMIIVSDTKMAEAVMEEIKKQTVKTLSTIPILTFDMIHRV
jgi:hypothetical protein